MPLMKKETAFHSLTQLPESRSLGNGMKSCGNALQWKLMTGMTVVMRKFGARYGQIFVTNICLSASGLTTAVTNGRA